MMRLNTLKSPARRQKRKRVGRGIGTGLGKTCGRGHKGQRARSGGRRDGNFEGGQMPLHRRVPKRGFVSRLAMRTANVRLSEIVKLQKQDGAPEEITVSELRRRGIVGKNIKRVRLFVSNNAELSGAVSVRGLTLSGRARAAVEAAGGKILDS